MKSIQLVFCLVILTFFFTSCKDAAQPEVKTVETGVEMSSTAALNPDATYAKAEFGIEGMTCAMGCAKTIEKNISKMEGVKSASVDFENKLAIVEYDIDRVSPATLEATVVKTSETYSVVDMKTITE